MTIRTRFAPSPTGHLHIGGARTALYCWLFARHHQGEFLLRIEDTDQERSRPEYTQAILDSINWLGLIPSQKPIYQSQRFARYHEVAQQLLASGHAYRCYCSKERLETIRNAQMEQGLKPRYDGHCREQNLPDIGKPHVIRFRTPQFGEVTFHDQVYGEITVANAELDDVILLRSDGVPTYNFSVVVDDHDMAITHVLRGDDHLNNTPRQILIYQALNASPPVYAHVPMILGKDGKKLSKRHGAFSVMEYREQGYLPEALLNYLVRLGWSHGDQEIFSREEMIRYFDLANINRAPAAFDPEKLLWLNQHYIKTSPPEIIAPELAWHLRKLDIEQPVNPDLYSVITAQAKRSKTICQMALESACFYRDQIEYDPAAAKEFLTPAVKPALADVIHLLSQLENWQETPISAIVKQVVTAHQLKFPQLAQALRIAATGSTASPSIDITLVLVGKEKTLQRLQAAHAWISE